MIGQISRAGTLEVVRAATPYCPLRLCTSRYLNALAPAGPASYWTAERLNAITLNPDPAVWIVGAGALSMVAAPMFVALASAGDTSAK